MKKIALLSNRLKLHENAIYFLAFVMPFPKIFGSFAVGFIVAFWLFTANYKERLKLFKNTFGLWIPVIFYLFYIVCFLNTTNVTYAFQDISIKLSLILLPLFLVRGENEEQINIQKVLKPLTLGILLISVYFIFHAVYNFYNEKALVARHILHDTYINRDFFFASRLSDYIHPSYFSMYINLSMVAIFYSVFFNDRSKIRKKIFSLVLIMYFSVFNFFLASKTGIFFTVLIWISAAVYLFWYKKRMVYGISFFVFIVITIIVLDYNSDIISSRFKYMLDSFKSEKIDKTTIESNQVRLLVWKSAWKVASENALVGVGTGDVKDELLAQYKRDGIEGAYALKLNAHNQFLQTLIATGITGLIILLVLLFYPLILSWRKRYFFGIFFSVLIIINFVVESMFETHAGIVFFAFFYSMFIIDLKRK